MLTHPPARDIDLRGRWPPDPAVPAIDGFARRSVWDPDSVTGAFTCFAVHSRARRRGGIYARAPNSPRKIDRRKNGYPRAAISPASAKGWAVHNVVDKMKAWRGETQSVKQNPRN